MADVDGRVIGRCREELEQGGFHPLYNGTTSNFLKRMVVQLSPRGEFLEDSAPRSEQPDPRIGRDPVIFLRPRTLGFAAAIEGILADVRTREDLPWSLLNIVGEESPIPDAEPADAETSENAAADRKSTRLNSSHGYISYAVFCLKKKNCLYLTLARPDPKLKIAADCLAVHEPHFRDRPGKSGGVGVRSFVIRSKPTRTCVAV